MNILHSKCYISSFRYEKISAAMEKITSIFCLHTTCIKIIKSYELFDSNMTSETLLCALRHIPATYFSNLSHNAS